MEENSEDIVKDLSMLINAGQECDIEYYFSTPVYVTATHIAETQYKEIEEDQEPIAGFSK
jgi:hypothetical protein